jgi:hypothetical protein
MKSTLQYNMTIRQDSTYGPTNTIPMKTTCQALHNQAKADLHSKDTHHIKTNYLHHTTMAINLVSCGHNTHKYVDYSNI